MSTKFSCDHDACSKYLSGGSGCTPLYSLCCAYYDDDAGFDEDFFTCDMCTDYSDCDQYRSGLLEECTYMYDNCIRRTFGEDTAWLYSYGADKRPQMKCSDCKEE